MILKLSIVLPLLLFSSIVSGLEWNDCGQPDRAVKINKIDYFSSNVIIMDGRALRGEVDFDIIRPLGSDVRITISLKRIFSFWGYETRMPIPCFGMCSQSLCELIDQENKLTRDFSAASGGPIKCPLLPRNYSARMSYIVNIHKLNWIPSAMRYLFSVS